MKFRLVKPPPPPSGVRIGACHFDHIYPSTYNPKTGKSRVDKGTSCYCGQRYWGMEEKRERVEYDGGKVLRRVRARNRFPHHDVLWLHGCGHVVTRPRGGLRISVRCRMCERIMAEQQERYEHAAEKKKRRVIRAKRLEEKLKWREQQGRRVLVKVRRKRRPKIVLRKERSVRIRVGGRRGNS